MSRKGNCYDNAVSESFFHTLKTELTHHITFETRAQANSAIFEYIELFYNRQRRHSHLGYLSPHQFELNNINLHNLDSDTTNSTVLSNMLLFENVV